eukprot:TRINITY_DN110345_c0_g1_i1.p1 TRINITY_DN110345_c0_g1~~TRINITY_DN110345_c0_g1_i1.p1  ORF type:complete len:292 (-),score=29.15 TRINITY_DN110345_c0_g1_i1:162-1037(-)
MLAVAHIRASLLATFASRPGRLLTKLRPMTSTPRHPFATQSPRPVAVRLCASTSSDDVRHVAVYQIAVYIQQQINGTFQDIFDRLDELLNLLEYPNNGSMTKVGLPDAKVMIEEIGACPAELEDFLDTDSVADKSLEMVESSMRDTPHASLGRHPRYVNPDVGCQNAAPDYEDVPTKDLIARSRKQADGIWVKTSGKGCGNGRMVARARIGGTFLLSPDYTKKHPIDTGFNVWYNSFMSPGWRPCDGPCVGAHPPKWYNVNEEDPPSVVDNRMKKARCIGFCREARRKADL